MQTKSNIEIVKKTIQEEQYRFPYHWLPQIFSDGSFSTGQTLRWGLEYLTYMDAITNLVKDIAPQKVLDIGCGDGRLNNLLSKYVRCEYVGIDMSERAILLAKTLNRAGEYHVRAISDLNQSYDTIVLVEVLEHIPDEEVNIFLREISNILSESGTLLLSVPTDNLPVNEKHFRHYNLARLTQEVSKNGLSISEVKYVFKHRWFALLLQRLAVNKFFTLNPSWITALIWKLHVKFSYYASSNDGAHLIAVVKKIKN